MDFLLLNSGRTAITGADIIQPSAVHFDNDIKAIAAFAASKDPKDLEVDVRIQSDAESVAIVLSLLNPTDYVRVAVYLTGNPSSLPNVPARIKGIKSIGLVDRRPEQAPVRLGVGVATYIVGL